MADLTTGDGDIAAVTANAGTVAVFAVAAADVISLHRSVNNDNIATRTAVVARTATDGGCVYDAGGINGNFTASTAGAAAVRRVAAADMTDCFITRIAAYRGVLQNLNGAARIAGVCIIIVACGADCGCVVYNCTALNDNAAV
ncbi:hypothetical protein SDC9_90415 [bioreactor metagenome]|uniref:Uncharacterized protein n=1 Tax=bioreactor metagenome TaxID=1076179 RepID=A0A644ZTM3_9ZZZZ